MFFSDRMTALKSALKATEDLGNITAFNISNSKTLGYKSLIGKFLPTCECQSFEELLLKGETGSLELKITKDMTPGNQVEINGKKYEESNVNDEKELKNLIAVANMTRSVLAGIQIDNSLQKEIINLSSS